MHLRHRRRPHSAPAAAAARTATAAAASEVALLQAVRSPALAAGPEESLTQGHLPRPPLRRTKRILSLWFRARNSHGMWSNTCLPPTCSPNRRAGSSFAPRPTSDDPFSRVLACVWNRRVGKGDREGEKWPSSVRTDPSALPSVYLPFFFPVACDCV
jgi:hypothetical protein